MSDDFIKVEHLKQYFPAGGFGKNKKFVQAVDDVSFTINKGEYEDNTIYKIVSTDTETVDDGAVFNISNIKIIITKIIITAVFYENGKYTCSRTYRSILY